MTCASSNLRPQIRGMIDGIMRAVVDPARVPAGARALAVAAVILVATAASAQTPAPAPLTDRSVCGNGVIDGLPASQRQCASCIPGQPCHCTGTSRTEECDGADLDGQTCVTRGYLAGRLRCTRRCTVDERSCRTPRPTRLSPARAVGLGAGAYVRDLALVASGDTLGAVWIANPSTPRLQLARFDRTLRPRGSVQSLGAFDRVGLAASATGWIVAMSGPAGTRVHTVAVDGTLGAEVAAFDGEAVELLLARDGAFVLGLRRTDRGMVGLRVVLLDGDGRPRGEPSDVFVTAQRGPDPVVSAVPIDDGWLIMRSWDGGVELAALDEAGTVAALTPPTWPGARHARLVATRAGIAAVYVDPEGLAWARLDTTGQRGDPPERLLIGPDELAGSDDATIVLARRRAGVPEVPGLLHAFRDGALTPLRAPADADAVGAFVFGRQRLIAWTTPDTRLVLARLP